MRRGLQTLRNFFQRGLSCGAPPFPLILFIGNIAQSDVNSGGRDGVGLAVFPENLLGLGDLLLLFSSDCSYFHEGWI